jgi:hypothetical protein
MNANMPVILPWRSMVGVLTLVAAVVFAAPASATVIPTGCPALSISTADCYTLDNVSDSDPTSISGTLTVNDTTDKVTGADISAGPFGSFDFAQITSQGDSDSNYKIVFDNGSFDFTLTLATAALLFSEQNVSVDSSDSFFVGSPVGGAACPFGGAMTSGVCSGTITGSLTTTPLPAALPLFAFGLFALGMFGLRRKSETAVQAAA